MCATAAALTLTACGMHSTPPAPSPQGALRYEKPMDVWGGPAGLQLNVLLGDAAPDLGGRKLKNLNLGIREIDAIADDGTVTQIASFDKPRIVDVLAHQDDSGESVANASVERSDYRQLRLVVDLASSEAVFRNNKTAPLNFLVNVGSVSSAGAGSTTATTTDGPGAVDIVVTQPFSIPQDHMQTARVDFNAFESLALDASGSLFTRASLFVAPVDQMGRVSGRVLNAQGGAVSDATVVAVASDGSIGNSSPTNYKGHFSIGTLRAGTYQLVIYNHYTTAAGREVTASGESTSAPTVLGPQVTVSHGSVTSAGIIAE